ncbi:MAG: geranylgeranyl reductase family protein [Candidatus Aminicenantes bacterium]|nr:geranylgeranyl reductase family protein [Candidatus Aminicenantes bacterium]
MTEDIRIDREKCCYCGGCVGVCPEDALVLKDTELKIDREKCTLCRICIQFCPVEAIEIGGEDSSLHQPETNIIQTDVVIVGAGPAGSLCAKYLAQAGVDVLVVEKKQEIGVPKRCAEAVDFSVFEKVGVEPHPLWLIQRIHSAVLHAPNKNSVKFGARTQMESGCIIERKIFEKHLAKDAILAGAKYCLKTTALRVLKNNDDVIGVLVEHMGVEKKIIAKITVAADGVDSKIAKSAGIDTVNTLNNYMSCFQYEMAGLSDIDEEAIHLYYGNTTVPGGYLWIFPKGNGLANVGVGINVLRSRDRSAKHYLDSFIKDHPTIFERSSPVEVNSGGVPVHQTLETLTDNGLMIIGDAAQLVNPVTGGGIDLAMLSGKLAAEVAVESLHKNDVSKKSLSTYQNRWELLFGKQLKKMHRLQRFMENLSDDDFNELADILTSNVLQDLAEGRFSGFVKLVLKKMPSLAHFAVKFLKSNL